ncbi:MAG: hypothetical protein H0V51_14470 [Chloroflexi bacterium]|nr:hypothetical protein [Chloroflexota bacterium]
MILERAVRAFGADRPVDRLTRPDLRAWLVELRTTLTPVSVAGYVRTLKVLATGSRRKVSPKPAHCGRSASRASPTSSSNPSPMTRFDGCSGSPPCATGRSFSFSSTPVSNWLTHSFCTNPAPASSLTALGTATRGSHPDGRQQLSTEGGFLAKENSPRPLRVPSSTLRTL